MAQNKYSNSKREEWEEDEERQEQIPQGKHQTLQLTSGNHAGIICVPMALGISLSPAPLPHTHSAYTFLLDAAPCLQLSLAEVSQSCHLLHLGVSSEMYTLPSQLHGTTS